MKRLLATTLIALGLTALALAEDRNLLAQLEQLGKGKFAVDPDREIVFPLIANGVSGAVGIRTSLVLTNPQEQATRVTIKLFNSNGGAFPVTMYDSLTLDPISGRSATITITIEGFESIFLQTDGAGRLAPGWAKASVGSGRLIGGVAAYQVFDSANPNLITIIVGVGASSASPAFFTPVYRNVHLGNNTAVALANNSTKTVYWNVILIGNPGFSRTTTNLSLGPRQQMSRYIHELFPSIESVFFGTVYFLQIDAAGELAPAFDVHAIALLESVGILSSVPVTNVVPVN